MAQGLNMQRVLRWSLVTGLLLLSQGALALDQSYEKYGALLKGHVHWSADGHSSTVDYAGLKRERPALKAVLAEFSAVSPQTFAGFKREQQMVFLINAYNAFTLELILTEYPELKSIRDLGSFFRSPWQQSFFNLLGEKRTLDWIEHERLRPVYKEPRIQFAVNCASIGCPALRPEPFLAAQLDAQFQDQQRRFLSDRSRNRYDAARNTVYVSKIFDWFVEDFEADGSLKDWLAARAELLADAAADQARIKQKTFRVDHLDYDWSLNVKR